MQYRNETEAQWLKVEELYHKVLAKRKAKLKTQDKLQKIQDLLYLIKKCNKCIKRRDKFYQNWYSAQMGISDNLCSMIITLPV